MSDDLVARLVRVEAITMPGKAFSLHNVLPWLRKNEALRKEAADRIAEVEAAYQAESDLGDALADQVQILLTERDRLAREVERMKKYLDTLPGDEGCGTAELDAICAIAHGRDDHPLVVAAINPEGETPTGEKP